jgi:hypothetical protein
MKLARSAPRVIPLPEIPSELVDATRAIADRAADTMIAQIRLEGRADRSEKDVCKPLSFFIERLNWAFLQRLSDAGVNNVPPVPDPTFLPGHEEPDSARLRRASRLALQLFGMVLDQLAWIDSPGGESDLVISAAEDDVLVDALARYLWETRRLPRTTPGDELA